jgi:hypothetical protein
MYIDYGYDEAHFDQQIRAVAGFGRVAHKPEVDGGDVPEGAEPGDTIYEFARLLPDGKPPRGCVRFWELPW